MKRTIALVLVLVLVIGMMAVPASADFTDSSDIQYTEAVEVVAAAGIINGFEDGSFDAEGTLTREQAAKVVAYLMLGETSANALPITGNTFTDVESDRWSVGYIEYAVNEGILAGRGDGIFDPTAEVTAYEFAKLMLGCLGYDATIEGYTGTSWAINVAKTALTIDLFDGNDGANYNVALTREEAALYIFNMIQTTMVDYENKGTDIDLGNGLSITTGASSAAEVTSSKSTIDDDGYLQFAELYIDDLELDVSYDDFGRPSNIWEYDGDDVGTYADTADFTYTTSTDIADIIDDIDDSDALYGTIIIDGVVIANGDDEDDDFTWATADNYKTWIDMTDDDSDSEIGGNGTLIEVYVDDEEVIIVVINTYVAMIVDWEEADEDEDEDEYVSVDIISNDAAITEGDFDTVQFSDDDVDDETIVLVTIADDEIQNMIVAEYVEAVPTGASSSKLVAGGETYEISANFYDEDNATPSFASSSFTASIDDEDEIGIYIDAYGYIIYVTDASGSADDYGLIIAYKDDDGFSDDDAVYYVKMILADGSEVTVEAEDGDDEDSVINEFDDTWSDVIVQYSVDSDGVYSLYNVDVEVDTKITTGDDDLIVKNSTTITLEDGTSKIYGNSDTVYFVAYEDDGDWDDYAAYVGYKNVPTIDSLDDTVLSYVLASDGYADVVYVYGADTGSSSSADDYVFIYLEADEETSYSSTYGESYYEVQVITSSGISTMDIEKDEFEDHFSDYTAGLTDAFGTFEDLKEDSNGLVTSMDAVTDDMYIAFGTNRASSDTLTFDYVADALNFVAGTTKSDGSAIWGYNDDTAVFTIEDDEISASSVSSIRARDYLALVSLDEDTNEILSVIIMEDYTVGSAIFSDFPDAD